jgi:hypothetical protein
MKMNETYVLRQCGTAELPAAAIPAGAKVFEIPLLGVSAADTTVIGFLVRRALLCDPTGHRCSCWL